MAQLITEIHQIRDRVIEGGVPTKEEAHRLLTVSGQQPLLALMAAGSAVREHFRGDRVHLCALISAKTGKCSENCKFCAQSAHYDTGSNDHPIYEATRIAEAAFDAERMGVDTFCIVNATRRPSKKEMAIILDAVKMIRAKSDIDVDCSIGFLSRDDAAALRDAGVTTINHNLETAKEHFPNVCTTHTYEDRVDTVCTAKAMGLKACSGGILGMGETERHRVDLAFALRDLKVDCVPINVLNPRPGTPLEGNSPPPPLDILKTIAMFRLVIPWATIKLAGGREVNLRDLQASAFMAGANGMIVGGYLTTPGRNFLQDHQMIKDLGLHTSKQPAGDGPLPRTGPADAPLLPHHPVRV